MLEYRVNIDKTKKTNVNIPVSSISFYEENDEEENNAEDVNDTEDDYTTYGSYNENQVLTTCTCHTLDKLANGSVINIMTILTAAYQGYTFNDKFKIFGLNKANKSFSFIYDKYYNLKPSTIIRRSDVAEDYFAGYDDYAKQIMLYLDSPHYFDTADYEKMEYRNEETGVIITEEDYNDKSPEEKEKYYQIITQKIPIYFRYVNDNNETVTETIEFSFYTFDSLVTNLKAFEKHQDLYNKIFGVDAYDDIGLKNDIIGTLNGITIFRDNFLFSDSANYTITFERPIIELDIPIKTTFENNLQQTDLLQTNFVDEEKKKAINKIVDLEKDVYYPVIKGSSSYTDVYTIRFNLHFREHRGVNWLINNESSWNGVEYKTVNGVKKYEINDKITKSDSSDLLTFLDFNNEDVRYQKNKLKKSFLRLNIYDSTNPANQNLIGYSTVFFNCGKLFEKYAKYYETDGYIDIEYKENIGKYTVNDVQKKGIRVNRDLFNNNTNTFDENCRLSSQFVVQSKNSSTSSSEGFYIYLWKEDESETPQDLYMKVEFNHAGYGRTIPFMMPYWDKQKWSNDNEKSGIKTFNEIINDWNSDKYIYYNKDDEDDLITQDEYLRLTPEQKKNYLLLDAFKWKINDTETDGHYGMRQYNKFSYIHLKYMYDETNDRHIYYLDPETYCKIVPVETWESNTQYHRCDRVIYNGSIWRCIKDNKESNFSEEYFEEVEIEKWKANTPYVCGDRVFYNNSIWRCIKDNKESNFSDEYFDKIEEDCVIDFPKGKDGNEEIVINLYEAKVE